jgi:hypothetical protein
MTNRNRRAATDRAEARRRARLAAQGLDDDLEASAEDAGPQAESSASGPGNFLGRLFPPAPPLPGKPDPLASFGYDGPLRGIVAGLYLLVRHPTPWIGMGALWAVGRLVAPGGGLAIIALLLSFGALIAAGWLGWPRPWLFGLAASIFGILYYAGIFAALVATLNSPDYPPGDAFVGAVYTEAAAFQPLFGALAGWYGGYLRRRMAGGNAAAQEASARRRR